MAYAASYLTDTGYRFTMISLSLFQSNDFTLPTGSTEKPEDFIPTSIRNRYRNDLEGCGSPKGIKLRSIVILAKSGAEYTLEMPMSPFETGWIQMISDLNSNNQIESYTINGEVIQPWLVNKLIN